MKDLVKEFKELTGLKLTEVAEMFGMTKQFLDQTLKNYSFTYTNSAKYILASAVDSKIEELENKVSELKELKMKIKNYKSS